MQAIDVQLARRAEFLTKRLNELGFRKNGNPMVVDQAFELVAAEEGFRNQHALRDKLKNYPALYIPYELDDEFAKAVMVQHTVDEDDLVYAHEAWEHIVQEAAKRLGVPPVTHESEHAAEKAWINVVNRMGWNDQSEILHLEAFIRERGLMGELAKYAETVAKEESSFTDDAPDGPSDAVTDTLEAIGYSVVVSDFSRPYWEFADDASTDFETEGQTWADAWVNAQTRTRELTGIDATRWSAMDEATQLSLVWTHLGGKSKSDQLRAVADSAFESYNFGDDYTVAGADGWESCASSTGKARFVRTVYLESKENPDADSVRHRLELDIANGKVVAANLTR